MRQGGGGFTTESTGVSASPHTFQLHLTNKTQEEEKSKAYLTFQLLGLQACWFRGGLSLAPPRWTCHSWRDLAGLLLNIEENKQVKGKLNYSQTQKHRFLGRRGHLRGSEENECSCSFFKTIFNYLCFK